jgi:hypothetical protein
MVNLKVKQSYTSVGDGGNQATNIYSFKWEVNVIWCFEIVVPNSRKKKEKSSAWRVFYCRSVCFNNVIQYMLQPKGSEVESPYQSTERSLLMSVFFFEKLPFNACNFKMFFADHRRRVEETGGFCSTHTPRNVIFSPEVVFFSTGY